jgi:hypothetical protein
MLGELSLKYKVAILIALVLIGGVVYFTWFAGSGILSADASSGDSSTGLTARPFIDYRSEDGRILRVYLDDGSKYWVNPDGTLTPYTAQTWTVPATMTAITDVRFGFDVTIQGKYLKDLNGDGFQDINLTVTSTVKAEAPAATGSYSVFSNSLSIYQVGSPTSQTAGSTTDTIQSNFISIDTIHSNVWGGTPAQDTDYKPKYEVTVTVDAFTYWGQPIQASASNIYGSDVIGYWNWKQSELSVSLGTASSSTQSLFNMQDGSGFMVLILAIGIILAILVFVKED